MKTLILGTNDLSHEIKSAENIDCVSIDNSNFAEQSNIHSSQSYDFYLYCMDGFSITYDNLQKLIDYISCDNQAIVAAAYSDITIVKDDVEFIQYNPSQVTKNYITNVPFIAKQQYIPIFNKEIANFHLWFGMLLLSQQYAVFHIPEPLFTYNAKNVELKNIDEDMRIINEIFK